MKMSALKSVLRVTVPKKLPVLLVGAPGIGKTDGFSQIAEECNADFLLYHPAVSDPTDYKGMPWASADRVAEFIPFKEHHKLLNAKRLTMAVFDDMGQAAVATQAAVMQFLLARRLNDQLISDHVVFLAATNRRTDKAGVSGLLEPVKSRFVTILTLEPDVDEWVVWALAHGMPSELIGFIRFRPNMLFDFKPTNDLTNSPNPRTVANVGKLFNAGIPTEVEYECFAGSAGEAFAAEFTGFLKVFRSLPTRESILLSPNTALVPEEPAALFATAAMLAGCASKTNVNQIVTYANRMPDEFSVVLMKDAIHSHRDEHLMHTKAFQEWASVHTQVMI